MCRICVIRKVTRYVSLVLLFFIFFAVQACFPEARRGSLSDAMDKASDDHDGDRRVEGVTDDDYDDDECEDDDDGYFIIRDGHEPDDHSDDEFGSIDVLSISGGKGEMADGDFARLEHVTLGFGWFHNEHIVGELNAGLKWSPLHETSKLQKSLRRGVMIASIGVDAKIFSTPGHTFAGHYFLFGASYNYMFWNYKNAIIADDYDEDGYFVGSERIESDGLSGFDLHAGTGVNLFQTERVQIGFEATPGIMIWLPHTTEGFRNDIFDPFPYIQFKFTLNFMRREKR